DGSLFKALYFSISCFNEGCTHASWLHRRFIYSSSILFSSLVLPIFALAGQGPCQKVRGSTRRWSEGLTQPPAPAMLCHHRFLRLAGASAKAEEQEQRP